MPKKTTITLLVCLLGMTAAWSANFGKVSGRVVDKASGEPLPGANIIIQGSTLGAVSDTQGYFVVLQVPPGLYSVQAKVLGYAPMRIDQVVVATNRIATLAFALTQTSLVAEAVEIIGQRPVIEKDITATSRSVSDRDIAVMPTNTVSEVLQAQPGVVSSGGLHIRGGRSGEITYYMDGIPLVDPLFTEINSSEIINRDAISEMQVISGTYSAEYGNSMSGIINITTKEGGDRLRADLNYKGSGIGLEKPSDEYNRTIFRGSLSGSLVPKTSFFLSGSYDDRDNYLPWGFRREGSAFVKLTDRHIKNIKLNLGVNLSMGKRKSYSHAFKLIPDSYWYEPETDSRLVQFGITHTLAANLYYSLNLYHNSYSYRSGDYDYNDLKPAYQLDENKEFYLKSYVTSYEKDHQSTLGLKGEMLWQANSYNEVKAGFELRRHTMDRFYISSPYYDDHILDDYQRKPDEAAAFIQDKINFSSIILSAGMRFDLFDPNSGFWPNPYDVYYGRTDQYKEAEIHTQLSPRLGISYPVSDRTVFHFGYGHYFQRPEYQYMYKSITDRDYDKNMIMALRTGNGRFGNPDLKPEKTVTYEFGLSHQLLESYLANITVYSKKITNLVGARTFFAGSRSDIWETYSLHINEDFAYNNGIELQLRKMRGRYFTAELNYTYAVAEGSSSGPLERVGLEEANRQTLKFFPLDFDQRHTINALAALTVPKGSGPGWGGIRWLEKLSAALLFQYGSGLAYTKGTRGATEPYEINNARLPEHWTLDLKIDREIVWGPVRLTPYLEVYNLTDRRNVLYVDPYTGRPDYSYGVTRAYAANPANWDSPRVIYLGLALGY
jgi:outer membrane receptor protein involved in Fe transport